MESFQPETLYVSNHAACRYGFFKGKTLYAPVRGASGPVVTTGVPACPLSRASIICFSAALSRTAWARLLGMAGLPCGAAVACAAAAACCW